MNFHVFGKKDKQKRIAQSPFIELEKRRIGDVLAVGIVAILIIFSFFAPNLFFMFFYLLSAISIGLLHIRNTKKKN